MKAIECLKYGGSENLILADVEKPNPKNNEVQIEIKATSVTASDVLIRRMDELLIPKFIIQIIFGFGKPRNPILGMVSSGSEVNTEKGERSTYVSPDESFLITANTYSDEKGFAVSFKKNGEWQRPVFFDLGEPIDEDWAYYLSIYVTRQQVFFLLKKI